MKLHPTLTMRRVVWGVLLESYSRLMAFMQSGLILIGLTALALLMLLTTQPQIRTGVQHLIALETRQREGETTGPFSMAQSSVDQLLEAAKASATQTTALLGLNALWVDAEPSQPKVIPVTDAAAAGPNLNKRQQATALYLSRKYHVSATAMGFLVRAADMTGKQIGLEPSLLLAVMAVESGFNPFAESSVGAQGVMQVMSKVHADKLDDFGGSNAALNPVTNLQVGALILKDCIRRGGSVLDGLRLYVGVGMGDDAGYGAKVLQEQQRIDAAAGNSRSRASNGPAMRDAPVVFHMVVPEPLLVTDTEI